MLPGSASMPVRRSCCQRTLSISCKWGGNYPWSVNTIHPQHLTCIWDRHSHAGPLLTIGTPCPQQMNSYMHLHKFHGSWLNPFMDQIVPPATTHCYCSTNSFIYFFKNNTHILTANFEIYESKTSWASSQGSIIFGKKEFVLISPLHKHLECRFLLPGLKNPPSRLSCYCSTDHRSKENNVKQTECWEKCKRFCWEKCNIFFFWCSDVQWTEAWVPIWGALEYPKIYTKQLKQK